MNIQSIFDQLCYFLIIRMFRDRFRIKRIRRDQDLRNNRELELNDHEMIVSLQNEVVRGRGRNRCDMCDQIDHNQLTCEPQRYAIGLDRRRY